MPFIAELYIFEQSLQFLNIGITIAATITWVLDFFHWFLVLISVTGIQHVCNCI